MALPLSAFAVSFYCQPPLTMSIGKSSNTDYNCCAEGPSGGQPRAVRDFPAREVPMALLNVEKQAF